VFLDLPGLTSDHVAYRPLLGASTSPWPGEMAVYRSTDPDDGYQLFTVIGQSAGVGTLAFDFYSGPVHRFDYGNALYVDMPTNPLLSVTDDELFGGANAFALETAPGVWEILQAGSAELLSPGRYKLSRLLRGQRGTEWAVAPMVEAGAAVVILDGALVELPVSEADIGVDWFWRVGPADKPVSDTSYSQAQFTPRAAGIEPFSGVHAVQPYRRGRVPGDLTIQWIRRSRDLSADIWSTGEIPLGEEVESYEVVILDGAAEKRVLASTTPSVVYTSAQQTADWGAPLGPGASLRVDIYQVAPLAGRGIVYSETLHF
jgi:hypothetical protein